LRPCSAARHRAGVACRSRMIVVVAIVVSPFALTDLVF
jgi:hypothetical protein